MGKMSDMAQTIEELRTAASVINDAADWLYQQFSGEGDNEQQYKKGAAKKENPKPEIKFEDVRALLAEKSRAGHTEEVRALLKSLGADKLSQVEPQFYEELMAEAEAIGNGG